MTPMAIAKRPTTRSSPIAKTGTSRICTSKYEPELPRVVVMATINVDDGDDDAEKQPATGNYIVLAKMTVRIIKLELLN